MSEFAMKSLVRKQFSTLGDLKKYIDDAIVKRPQEMDKWIKMSIIHAKLLDSQISIAFNVGKLYG